MISLLLDDESEQFSAKPRSNAMVERQCRRVTHTQQDVRRAKVEAARPKPVDVLAHNLENNRGSLEADRAGMQPLHVWHSAQ
jgi:hypothetical protein